MQKSNVKSQLSNVMTKSLAGFTFIEILLVISITVIVATAGTVSYLKLRDSKALLTNTEKIVQALRTASSNSLSGLEDSTWGMRFTNNTTDYFEVWYGADYTNGTKGPKNILSTPVFFTNPSTGTSKDIVFSRGSGLPVGGDTCIALSNGSAENYISILSSGRIEVVPNC